MGPFRQPASFPRGRLARKRFPTDAPCMTRVCLAWMAVLATCVAGWPAGFTNQIAPEVSEVGRIMHPEMTEVSGVVASRRYPGTFWIHTDGGKKPLLIAINRDGETVAKFEVSAKFSDWEDIAINDQGHLFLGDLGNNDGERKELRVYRLAEPDMASTGKRPKLRPDQTWRLRFPHQSFDCESLFVVGTNGFVISKLSNNEQARVYRFPLTQSKEPVTLDEVGVLPIKSPVTGADVSKDGKLLAVVAKQGAHIFRIDGDPANAGRLGRWFTPLANHHVEGCTLVEDGLLATAETRSIYVFTNQAFRGAPLR